MSDLLELTSSPGSIILHIEEILQQIGKEFKETTDPHKRDSLLGLHHYCTNICASYAKSRGSNKDSEELLEEISRSYWALLAWEAVDADGLVDPEQLEIVTGREISMGRMSKDNRLRKMAVEGAEAGRAAKRVDTAEEKPGATGTVWRRIISFFMQKNS